MRPTPLVLGVGAGLIALALLTPATVEALDALAAARGERARLAAVADVPAAAAPVLAPGLPIAAADAKAARAAMAGRIEALARAGGVLVEEVAGVAAPAPAVALRVRLSGAEKAVLALADALERERPLMRFRSWRIEPVAGGGVRLSGEAVAAWE